MDYCRILFTSGGPPVPTGPPAHGFHAIDLAGPGSLGGVETILTTTPGERYRVALAMGSSRKAGRSGSATLTVSADGQAATCFSETASPQSTWITFQPYDIRGTALHPHELNGVTAAPGQAVDFKAESWPLRRIVVTSPGGATRLLRVSWGPMPGAWHRELKELVSTPTRNPQPAADTLWVFRDEQHQRGEAALETVAGETGLRLAPETAFEFSHDQRRMELRLVVAQGGVVIKAGASGRSDLGPALNAPEVTYPAGAHVVRLLDSSHPADFEPQLGLVHLLLVSGEAIMTHVSTPFYEE